MEDQGYVGDISELQNVPSENCNVEVFNETGRLWPKSMRGKRTYVALLSAVGFLQSMLYAYFIAVSTSLEKQFKLKSQLTGIILSANEFSEVILALILAYFGSKASRPKMLAFGTLCATLSCALAVIPHLVSDKNGYSISNRTTSRFETDSSLCMVEHSLHQDADSSLHRHSSAWPVIFLFFSKFVSGIANTLFFTLGFTFMDDNVKKTQTPYLLGLVQCVRLLGPTAAFAMSSGLLNIHVTLNPDPGLRTSDPQWIGAWWIGFIVIGSFLPILSFLLFLFPREINNGKPGEEVAAEEGRNPMKEFFSFNGFLVTLKRTFSNRMLILLCAGNVFRTFAFSGQVSFQPKFLEQQFQQTASDANLINGAVTVVSMSAGLLIAGAFISRWKPQASSVQAWSAIVGFLYFCCYVGFAFMKCNRKPLFGEKLADGRIDLLSGCSRVCNCGSTDFTPVCSSDGLANFYSACHAGCRNFTRTEDGTKVYSDCSCTLNKLLSNSSVPESDVPHDSFIYGDGNFTEGYCINDCYVLFLVYVCVVALIEFLNSTTIVGNLLINLRCVKKEDKAVAVGMGGFLMSLLGFIPGPIIYGALIDKTCILWQENGTEGNCWMYDPKTFQITFHLLTASCYLIGTICDLILRRYVLDLDLYGDGKSKDGSK